MERERYIYKREQEEKGEKNPHNFISRGRNMMTIKLWEYDFWALYKTSAHENKGLVVISVVERVSKQSLTYLNYAQI